MMRTLLAVLVLLAAGQACLFTARPHKDTLDPARLPKDLYLVIDVGDYGVMALKLYTEDAPYNSANVANLAIKGFYNGLTFHRIIPGFVVQGGDPQGDGTGGPGYDVRAEIKRLHVKGAIAMARTGDEVNPERKSSGSQFYLCLEALPRLDNNYTVIGEMVWGFDVLARLGNVPTDDADRPLRPVVIRQAWATTRRPRPPRL